MQSVLTMADVSKSFAGTKALDRVSLSIAPGEIRAIVGQNGCGKSTLIKVLAGVCAADTGAITVAGEPVQLGNARAVDAAGIRFVHQDLGLISSLDATDNIALGPGYEMNRLGLISWNRSRASTREQVRRLGYDIDASVRVGDLTAADRTAIAISRALSERASVPRLLVLDEPTANLPAPEVATLFELVRRVQRTGVAVLFVSHHLQEVFELCDSVTVLRDGRHVITREVAGLDEATLVNQMIGRDLVSTEVRPVVSEQRGSVVLVADRITSATISEVSLTVRSGDVVGVAGITGSGREQVAEAIFGGRSRRGAVSVAGVQVPAGRPDLAMAAGVGLVPADRHTNAAFLAASVRENVTAAEPGRHAKWGLISRRREEADVGRWLRRLHVRHSGINSPLAGLSGGNQQKVVIARWLRREPKVLILDEPTQGVDVGAKAEIHALVEGAAAAGAAVLVISTDHEELERLCSRVLVMRGGRVADQLYASQVTSDRITAATLGGAFTASTAVDEPRI